MIDIEISSYWNVEVLRDVFQAIASVMGSNGNMTGLFRLAFLVGLVLAIFGYLGRHLEMFKWFIHAFVFVTVLNMPIARVWIQDKTGVEQTQVVDNVPFALAAVAQVNNLVFGKLTELYETAFSMPDTVRLNRGDIGFGHRILRQMNKVTIRDPQLRADLMQFFKECTVYDIRDGVINYKDIVSGTDVWDKIFKETSPARFVTYNTLSGAPKTDTCQKVGVDLGQRIITGSTVEGESYQRTLNTSNASRNPLITGAAEGLLANVVGQSYGWILGNAANGAEALRQSMFNNLWRDAGTELPTLLNDPARVAEANALMAEAQAARQADGSNSSLSMLAQETLPHMRNWIEAIIYAMFPVIIVLMVVSPTESAKRIFSGYMMSLVWIGLWPLLFAVINHLSMMHLKHKLAALDLAANGVPFQMSDAFDATIVDEQAAIGYMVVLVPFIAAMIVRMGQGGVTAMADRMMTSFSSAGASAGASMAAGNVHMGQVGMDTASVNMTTMHRYDSNVGLFGGGGVVGYENGDVRTLTADGHQSVQRLRDILTSSGGMTVQHDAFRSDQGYANAQMATGRHFSAGQGQEASYGATRGHDAMYGTAQDTRRQHTFSDEAADGYQFSDSEHLAKMHGSGASMDQRFGATTQSGASLGVSGGAGLGGGGQGKGNASGKSGAGFSLSGGFSGNVSSAASAQEGRNQTVNTTHTRGEHSQNDHSLRTSIGVSESGGSGEHSSQNDHLRRDASWRSSVSQSDRQDVGLQNTQGVGSSAGRSQRISWNYGEDVLSNPDVRAAVERHFGMRKGSLLDYSDSERGALTQQYLAETGVFRQVQQVPQHGLSGDSIPTGSLELQRFEKAERQRLQAASNPSRAHDQHVRSGGFKTPARVDTVSDRASIQKDLNDYKHEVTRDMRALSDKSAPFVKHTHDWVSPDRKVGTGRAAPAVLATEIHGRAIADSFSRTFDSLTGGDGLGNGEKAADVMTDPVPPDVRVGKRN